MELKWGLKIVMHVIDKPLTVNAAPDKPVLKRRSFFIKLATGMAGGWAAGNLITAVFHPKFHRKNNEAIRVTINPLAVPRTKKENKSHGG